MPGRIVHGLAVKFYAVFRWRLAARGRGPPIALLIVEMVIHLSVEMIRRISM